MDVVKRHVSRRSWTKEEEAKLVKLSAKLPKSGIADALGRSPSSVNHKRMAMGIESFTEQMDCLTLSQIARLVGADKQTISRTWKKYGLQIRAVGCYRVVEEKNLFSFMKNHPELWKATKCDYYFFCRYKWFQERFENERTGIDHGSHYQNRKSWTSEEISRLKMLKRRGLTHREIAVELGRTKMAVDHMIMRCKEDKAYE